MKMARAKQCGPVLVTKKTGQIDRSIWPRLKHLLCHITFMASSLG